MPHIEQKQTGLWQVHFEAGNPQSEEVVYERFLSELVEIMDKIRFDAMRDRRLPCYQAVANWTNLKDIYPQYQFGSIACKYKPAINDIWGHDESGQITLGIHHPGFDTSMLMDVAAYIFGFEYDEMPVIIGTRDTMSQAMTDIYSAKFGQRVGVTVGRIF